jgi:hypothetical protein
MENMQLDISTDTILNVSIKTKNDLTVKVCISGKDLINLIFQKEKKQKNKYRKNEKIFDIRSVNTHINAIKTGRFMTGAEASMEPVLLKLNKCLENSLKNGNTFLTEKAQVALKSILPELTIVSNKNEPYPSFLADISIKNIQNLIGSVK